MVDIDKFEVFKSLCLYGDLKWRGVHSNPHGCEEFHRINSVKMEWDGCLLYCIYRPTFIQRFLQWTPIRGAPSARDPVRVTQREESSFERTIRCTSPIDIGFVSAFLSLNCQWLGERMAPSLTTSSVKNGR